MTEAQTATQNLTNILWTLPSKEKHAQQQLNPLVRTRGCPGADHHHHQHMTHSSVITRVTTHNLSIRTYDYWHRLSERRLSSEYSVLILFRIRILYQSLRKLCRSEIFSLFLNLFVSYALLFQETSWMDSRPHRPPASITRCLLQKLWHFTRWWAPGLGARERSIAQGRIRRNLLWSRQSALAVRSTPACSVLSSGRSLWATLKLVLPWKSKVTKR